ncbi:MAG: type I 3-dehydroquinate dehydratase [Lachnospiraceae bacterium]|nr:type I 3-dehydroquinate dehydratase [Lachnospiraceae bacterium]
MRVKNIDIENFKPIVCVPIVDNTVARSLETARVLALRKVPVIEWRLDYLKELNDKDAIINGLKEFSAICKDNVTIATIRTKAQGGLSSFNESEMELYLSLIANNKCVDFIDVEYFTYERPKKLIDSLKSLGANVICSNHDFEETPEDEMILTLLEEMDCSACDGVKMAVMPSNSTDVTRFMDVCNSFAVETKKLFISMSMGELGKVSRLAGNVTGSCITYGAYNKTSAPGQMDYKKLMEYIGEDD